MGDTHHDPVDHSRTHNQHAGESMIDVYFWPGFFLLAMWRLVPLPRKRNAASAARPDS